MVSHCRAYKRVAGQEDAETKKQRSLNSPSTDTDAATGMSVFALVKKPHSRMTLFLSMLLVYITINQINQSTRYGEPTFILEAQTGSGESSSTETERFPRLGDGCYHIYLDVGANVGIHGRFLLEPQKYPESEASKHLFKKQYGLLDNRDVCVFEFEANPMHWPRLNEISQAYKKMGWRYHVVQAAASDKSGSITFFHNGDTNELGFGALTKHFEELEGGASTPPPPKIDKQDIEIPAIRLSEWIQTHIHERIVPEIPPSRNGQDNNNESETTVFPQKPPFLGMKIDIEGSEYVVLPDLIHSGTICNFDLMFGEFHTKDKLLPIRAFRESKVDNNGEGKAENAFDPNFHRISLETKDEAQAYIRSLIQVIHGSRNCHVQWITFDDESYVFDGKPLPTPPALRGR